MADIQSTRDLHSYFPFGFQVSRQASQWLDARELIEEYVLKTGLTENYAVRILADRFNIKRHPVSQFAPPVHAGDLITAGVIVDIFRYLVDLYCFEENPGTLKNGDQWIRSHQGEGVAERPAPIFTTLFPPIPVFIHEQSIDDYLSARTEKIDNREISSAEMILLSLSTSNPAFKPFRGLFDDSDLKKQAPYSLYLSGMEKYFSTQPVFKPLGMPLFDCLRAPILASPDSLDGQLEYIHQYWSSFLPAELLRRLILAVDILREEKMMRGWGPGPNIALRFGRGAYGYDDMYPEPAAFSRDADWMSNVVLLAKTVYVWLDQLSRRFQRDIKHLDQVPDEELDRLARWGFTGLWLIGLWERSPASQKIKQIMGNPEAAPSAYSLYDYEIAHDLGGEAAYQDLRERAWQRGIRLASDMVPNHMGIYSRWVIEHPDWFLQSSYPPFPNYRFTGTDLSNDERVLLQIEDGYWEHRDASVVFRREDRWTGDVRFIYHGNDGTSTPWNDTAQLNFMLPEVREAVIQLILHVARKFPIIRFDAAMTLAKKHFQRLWFPKQGDGGAIPSRAEHSMSREEFDRVFPKEFWREVVDRVAAEVPETLLLAEAFWLMEGYFVRTLGMHRVYNSAFMNMLKMEDNAKYRATIKNVLEFSPEIIKRFVNFMNNPDERTAVEQFGKDDKYYGVAMMMVTMPGLPMFGHGQVEGFAEKYGMEYRKAYWDEQVDEHMISRHERDIFPLMRRRRLFSGAANFALYDFNTPDGWVDENVFAYSNRAGDERAVILYNNAYNTTRGWINRSTAINVGSGDDKHLVHKALADALGLHTGDNVFYTFRDYRTGLQYIRSGQHIASEGMFASLHAYQYHAFLDFTEIHDDDGSWRRLAEQLNGFGVPNIHEAHREMILDPILQPFRHMFNVATVNDAGEDSENWRESFLANWDSFAQAAIAYFGLASPADGGNSQLAAELGFVAADALGDIPKIDKKIVTFWHSLFEAPASLAPVLVAISLLKAVGHLRSAEEESSGIELIAQRFDSWMLGKSINDVFKQLPDINAHETSHLVRMLATLDYQDIAHLIGSTDKLWHVLTARNDVRAFIQVHHYEGKLWMNKELLQKLLDAFCASAILRLLVRNENIPEGAAGIFGFRETILARAEKVGYQFDAEILGGPAKPAKRD